METASGSEVAALYGAELTKAIFQRASSSFLRVLDGIKISLPGALNRHVQEIINRTEFVRTLIGTDSVTRFDDIYVGVPVWNGQTILSEGRILDLLSGRGRLILRGIAGSGKTMLLRRLARELPKRNVLPVLVEMRKLRSAAMSLREFLKSQLTSSLDISDVQFEAVCRSGRVCFLLDGLDEIPLGWRRSVLDAIERAMFDWSFCAFIATARPDSNGLMLSGFDELKLAPLDAETALRIAESHVASRPKGAEFIREFRDVYYDNYRRILDVPIIIQLMYIVYARYGRLSVNSSVLYKYVFECFFIHHDSTKSDFSRDRRWNVDIPDLEKIVSAVCAASYVNQLYYLSYQSCIELISRSLRRHEMSASSDDVLSDMVECVCLLVRDGLDYTFVHRSFQEYFTARFMLANLQASPDQLKFRILSRGGSDVVMDLMLDMDPISTNSGFFLPATIGVIDRFSKIGSESLVEMIFPNLVLRDGEILLSGEGRSEIASAGLTLVSRGTGWVPPSSFGLEANELADLYERLKAKTEGDDETDPFKRLADVAMIRIDQTETVRVEDLPVRLKAELVDAAQDFFSALQDARREFERKAGSNEELTDDLFRDLN